MFPNINTVDADTIKRESEKMQNMSDDELQRTLNRAKSFMPGKYY